MDSFAQAPGSPRAILYVNVADSVCSHCGKSADFAELRHREAFKHGDGCGALYVAVSSHYVDARMEKRVRLLRADLPWLDPREAHHTELELKART